MSNFNEDQFFQDYNDRPQEAFRQMMDEFRDRVFVTCVRATSHRQDAEDLTQDVFIRVWKGLSNFQRKSSLNTWVYHIAWNVCASYLKKKGNALTTTPYSEIDDEEDVPFIQLSMNDPNMDTFEKKQFLAKLFKSIPENQQLVLTLFYLQEQTYDEIATITGWPIGTVKATIHRAKAGLRTAAVAEMQTV